jgi:hypothetical protein
MQRTNLAIRREIIGYCRKNKIPFSNVGSCLYVCSIAISVHEGYVYGYFFLNGRPLTYQVEYLSVDRWYRKFDIFRVRSIAVFRLSPKNGLYEKQRKVNLPDIGRL